MPKRINREPGGLSGLSSVRTRRNLLLRLVPTLALFPLALATSQAASIIYYDRYGNAIAVQPELLTAPVVLYDQYGRAVTIYPTNPVYVPGPRVRGVAGVRGQSRRVARRTARRTARRLN